MISIRFRTLLLGLFVLMAMAPVADGQTKKSLRRLKIDTPILQPTVIQSSVTPVVYPGQNIKCSDLNTDPTYSLITTDQELKLNFTNPNGTYPYTNGDGRVVTGTELPNESVTISSASSSDGSAQYAVVYSWSSTIAIPAVIIKVGPDSYVYYYDPMVMGDTNLFTNNPLGISHVSFCFEVRPTAAPVTISGRVLDSYGNGIQRASVTIQDMGTGELSYSSTSTFGYYEVTGLLAGRSYIISVRRKGYTFDVSQKFVSALDDMEVNFIARE